MDCKKYDVVTHSEDEKPLDCKMEKKPLEKPLTEEQNPEEYLYNIIHKLANGDSKAKINLNDLIYEAQWDDAVRYFWDKIRALEEKGKIKITWVDPKKWQKAYCQLVESLTEEADFVEITDEDLEEEFKEIVKKPGDATIAKLKKEYPDAVLISGDKLNDDAIAKLNKDSVVIIDNIDKAQHGQGFIAKLNNLGCKVFSLKESLTEAVNLTEEHDVLTPAELAIFKDCCTSTTKVSEMLNNLIANGLGKKDIIWLDHRDYRSWYNPLWVSGYIKRGWVTGYRAQYNLEKGYIILDSWEESLWCSYKKDARVTKLTEAKKDEDELPPDPEVVKLETHQELNDLVADEINTINGYEDVKADVMEKPIEHKDDIIDTINHIEDEEKEHIDELNDVVSEISFGGSHKEAAPAPVVEEKPEEDFVELADEDLEEDLKEEAVEENMQDQKYLNHTRAIYADYDSDDFEINVDFGLQDSEEYEVTNDLWILEPGQTAADLVIFLAYNCGFNHVYLHGERTADRTDIQAGNHFTAVQGIDPADWEAYGNIEQRIVEEKEDNTPDKYFACLINGRDVIGYVRAKNNDEADRKMERIWPEYFPAAWDGDNYTIEVNREEIDDDEDEIYDIDSVKDRVIQVKLSTNEVLERDFDADNIDNEFDLAFESYNVYGEKLTEAKDDKFTCCICGEESYGYGNNPYPVKDDGRCCDSCNSHYVVPARLELIQSERANKDND